MEPFAHQLGLVPLMTIIPYIDLGFGLANEVQLVNGLVLFFLFTQLDLPTRTQIVNYNLVKS